MDSCVFMGAVVAVHPLLIGLLNIQWTVVLSFVLTDSWGARGKQYILQCSRRPFIKLHTSQVFQELGETWTLNWLLSNKTACVLVTGCGLNVKTHTHPNSSGWSLIHCSVCSFMALFIWCWHLNVLHFVVEQFVLALSLYVCLFPPFPGRPMFCMLLMSSWLNEFSRWLFKCWRLYLLRIRMGFKDRPLEMNCACTVSV